MRNYKPRRQSKRWLDGDCPAGVLAILDAGPKEFERWTVIYAEPICGTRRRDMTLWFRGMSNNPSHPQGVGMAGEMSAHEVAAFRYRSKPVKWSALPEAVKACVRRDCQPE